MDDIPPIIRSSKTVIAASGFTYVFGCQQPKMYVKPEAAITVFELLMMGSVSPETCWAIKKQWNNKFYYTVASCWFFPRDLYYDARIHEYQDHLFLYEVLSLLCSTLYPSLFPNMSARNTNLIMADINTNIFIFINISKPINYFTYCHNSHSKILHVAHIVYAFCMAFRTNSNFYLTHH